MNILIITPLFPPDIGAPASYVKTLVKKLYSHEVALLIYGYLPEVVSNITPTTIDKRKSKLSIMLSSVRQIIKNRHSADIILVNNGPSTELPIILCSFFIKQPIVLCLSDPIAIKASSHGLYYIIHKLCRKLSTTTIPLPDSDSVYLPPEKLPFTPTNPELVSKQKDWWDKHIQKIFSYVKK